MSGWLRSTPIWLLGLLLFLSTVASAYAGSAFSRWLSHLRGEGGKLSGSQEGYVVSSIFALLALMLAFTFGLAMERYQVRRHLVVEEATAIEALYLKAQLLEEPDRSRFSNLLIRYTQNHLALAKLNHNDASAQRLLADDDLLVRDLWIATVPAFQRIKMLDFSSSFVEAVANVVRIDAERKAVRRSEIPTTILVALLLYTLAAGAVLGGVMKTRKGRQFCLGLLTLDVLILMLIADINRPVEGTIHESQEPMKRMLARIQASPPVVYQRLAQPPR